MIQYLKGAIKDENHRYMGFGVGELIESIGLIAKNDNNKKIVSIYPSRLSKNEQKLN